MMSKVKIVLKNRLLIVIISLLSFSSLNAQGLDKVFTFIKDKSDIREGGCDIFSFNGQSLLIAVAPVVVGEKSELNCKKVGSAKAKKDMISFINGSEISSFTSLTTSEAVEQSLSGERVELKQVFTESIKERVIGQINMIVPLGGWYSEDGSLYYYSIYKTIE